MSPDERADEFIRTHERALWRRINREVPVELRDDAFQEACIRVLEVMRAEPDRPDSYVMAAAKLAMLGPAQGRALTGSSGYGRGHGKHEPLRPSSGRQVGLEALASATLEDGELDELAIMADPDDQYQEIEAHATVLQLVSHLEPDEREQALAAARDEADLPADLRLRLASELSPPWTQTTPGGVSWSKRERKWVVRPRVRGQKVYLGEFAQLRQATEAINNYREGKAA